MEVIGWQQISVDISSVPDSEDMNKPDQRSGFMDLIDQCPNDWNGLQM